MNNEGKAFENPANQFYQEPKAGWMAFDEMSLRYAVTDLLQHIHHPPFIGQANSSILFFVESFLLILVL